VNLGLSDCILQALCKVSAFWLEICTWTISSVKPESQILHPLPGTACVTLAGLGPQLAKIHALNSLLVSKHRIYLAIKGIFVSCVVPIMFI